MAHFAFQLAHCASVDLAARCNRTSASHPHSLHNSTAKSYATRRMLVDVCRAGFRLIGAPGQTQVVGGPTGAYAGGGVLGWVQTRFKHPLWSDPRKFLSFFRAGAASWPASNVYQLLWKRSSSVQKRSPLPPLSIFATAVSIFFLQTLRIFKYRRLCFTFITGNTKMHLVI